VSGDAENQQERLIEFRGWVIGFVDGEGCFSISFVRQQDRIGRKGYRVGYQVSPQFTVS
jgi:LAGLIDADG endonuclease